MGCFNDSHSLESSSRFWNYGGVISFLVLACTPLAPADDAVPERIIERIAVSEDHKSLLRTPSNTPFTVWGVNYDHDDQGRLIEDYWQKEWETVVEDFKEIRALGANVVRVHLQVGKFMRGPDETNQDALDQLARLIELANATGLYLDLTGLGCYHRRDIPEWYITMTETDRWEVQARFWKAIASVARGKPAVFCYDLMNEPILPGEKPEQDWLAGDLEGKHFVQRITLDLKGRTRTEVARQWVARMCQAIREIDQETLITLGVIPWSQVFPGAKPIFYAPDVHGPLDFVSIHLYPKGEDVAPTLKAMEAYEIGKPLLIEEIFPLSASIDTTVAFIEAARPRVVGFVSFYWGTPAAENERKGTIAGSITAAWLKAFQK